MPPGRKDAAALAHERAIVGRVLHDAVRVDEIERSLAKRQRLAVGDGEACRQLLEREILRRQRDRRRREVDAGDHRAVSREANQIGAGAASDLEHAAAAILIERHETRQMMQLLEVILLEIGEEAGEPGGCVVMSRS